ncbi:MAG: class I SAM-dependent methyltransferase, partial [Halobacteriales archaeon]
MKAEMDAARVVRVALENVETTISRLRARGCYDERRSVVQDGDTALLPVIHDVEGHEVERHEDPVYRRRELDDVVDVEDPPSGWSTVGDVALVRLDGYTEQEKHEIARGILDVAAVDSVHEIDGVHGETRRPRTRRLAGEGDTETTHREHGVVYRLDPTEVTFSVGNQRERLRVQRSVGAGERALDMFAGVGYWSLPAAVGGADVTAIELNPEAADYLRQGAEANDVAGRIEVHVGDCRDVVDEIEIQAGFDRVFMGYFEARRRSYLDAALDVAGDRTKLHLHDAAHESAVERAAQAVRDVAGARGYETEVSTREV